MKTPQPKFIVEFKSGRRQPKARNNSIWGDTDLKALVREVEDNVPDLFKSNEAPRALGEGGDMPSDRTNSGSASGDEGKADVAPAAFPLIAEVDREVPQHGAGLPVVEAIAQTQEIQPVPQPGTTSSDPSPTRPESAVEDVTAGTNEEPSVQSSAAQDEVSFDELIALDAENQRLKGLLTQQLHAQNLQLKKMLERFGAA